MVAKRDSDESAPSEELAPSDLLLSSSKKVPIDELCLATALHGSRRSRLFYSSSRRLEIVIVAEFILCFCTF